MESNLGVTRGYSIVLIGDTCASCRTGVMHRSLPFMTFESSPFYERYDGNKLLAESCEVTLDHGAVTEVVSSKSILDE